MPDRAQLEAYAESLLDKGHSEDEVVSMLQSAAASGPAAGAAGVGAEAAGRSPAGVPSSLARNVDDLGPSPRSQPMNLLDAQEQRKKPRSWLAEKLLPEGMDFTLPDPGITGIGDPSSVELPPDVVAADPSLPGMQEAARTVKNVGGSMAVGGALGGLASRAAAPAVQALGGGLLARTAGAAAAGAAAGPATSAAMDLAGGNVEGMGERAKASILPGAILGGGGHLLGEAMTGTGNAVINSKGGQARQDIEAVGGNVSPLTSGNQGPFAPGGRLAGRETTDRGIGEVSRESAGNILNRIRDTHAAEVAPATAELNRLDRVFPEEMVDASALANEVQTLARHPRLSDAQRATVAGWERRLQNWQVNDPRTGQYVGVYMPAGELNALKGLMQDATNVGALGAASVPTNMQRGAPAGAKALVDQTAYGPPNAQAHAAHVNAETQRRLLRLPDAESGGANTPEGLPRSEVERVTNLLSRQGQNTVTAGGQNTSVPEGGAGARESLDVLATHFPGHAQDVRLPRALAAKGDLEFRLLPKGDKGGMIERLKAAGPAVAGLAAGGGTAVAGHPLLGALLGGAGLAAMNSTPIAGRLLYRPALMARGLGQAVTAEAPGMGAALSPVVADQLQALMARLRAERGQENQQ